MPLIMEEAVIEEEYSAWKAILEKTNIIVSFPKTKKLGIIGLDGREYPLPTLEQVLELFDKNQKLVNIKYSQGFKHLELVPLALPLPQFTKILERIITEHRDGATPYKTRRLLTGALVPTRVNKEKLGRVWETLEQAYENKELIYFPQEFSDNNKGMTKLETINNPNICSVPGWAIGLTEGLNIIPQIGKGKILKGRKQLEAGCSPNEYLEILKGKAYVGETGKTLEDFILEFIFRLEKHKEVSFTDEDNNGLWCLGQYYKLPYDRVVPVGRWLGKVGRVRLDSHRTNNKLCTQNIGTSTVVRLPLL